MSTQTSQTVVSAPVAAPVAQQTPAPVSTPSPVPQTLSSSSSSSMSTRSNHSHTNIANDEYIPPKSRAGQYDRRGTRLPPAIVTTQVPHRMIKEYK